MTTQSQQSDDFDVKFVSNEQRLIVDVDGFEGPLDLLLALARTQKVDLTRISVLALVEQYFQFIEEAQRVSIELAADYLLMAAWLAYLKSRLLVPKPEMDEEPSGEELAAALAFRLQRLEAMRKAAADLMKRYHLARDVFARGAPEPLVIATASDWSATLYDLLHAYATQRQRKVVIPIEIKPRAVWSLTEARALLEPMIATLSDWTPIDCLLEQYLGNTAKRDSIMASSLLACLEMVREGYIELRQEEPLKPLYVRAKPISCKNDGVSDE